MSNKIIGALLAVFLFSPITAVYAQDLFRRRAGLQTIRIGTPELSRLSHYKPGLYKDHEGRNYGEKDFPISAVSGRIPLVVIDQIINISPRSGPSYAERPVVNIDTKYAAAMPQGITGWNQLAEWKKPRAYLYGFYARTFTA